MLDSFSIDINTDEQMVTIRETLRSLGYKIFESFDDDNERDGWKVISMQGEGEVARSYWRNTDGNSYRTLEEFLVAHFNARKTPEQLELEQLKQQAKEIKARIAELEAK